MNTETQIIDFFKREFLKLVREKKSAKRKDSVDILIAGCRARTTYNIACEVLGSHTADLMATDAGL